MGKGGRIVKAATGNRRRPATRNSKVEDRRGDQIILRK